MEVFIKLTTLDDNPMVNSMKAGNVMDVAEEAVLKGLHETHPWIFNIHKVQVSLVPMR